MNITKYTKDSKPSKAEMTIITDLLRRAFQKDFTDSYVSDQFDKQNFESLIVLSLDGYTKACCFLASDYNEMTYMYNFAVGEQRRGHGRSLFGWLKQRVAQFWFMVRAANQAVEFYAAVGCEVWYTGFLQGEPVNVYLVGVKN